MKRLLIVLLALAVLVLGTAVAWLWAAMSLTADLAPDVNEREA